MKTIILYTSKLGATKQYVKWLEADIAYCTVQNLEENPNFDSTPYQRIIFALPTYGGVINKKEVLETNWEVIKSKAVYLIVVGGVPQEAKWSQRSYNTLKKEVREGLRGYVKLIGLAENPDKKSNKFEKFFMRLILQVDPDTLENRKEVFQSDLQPALDMLHKGLE